MRIGTDIPDDMRSIACLSDDEIIAIARIAKATEERLGAPQDMEWAIDQDLALPQSLFWLQTRQAKVAVKKSRFSRRPNCRFNGPHVKGDGIQTQKLKKTELTLGRRMHDGIR